MSSNHALEIRRMEREAQALQTAIDANPSDLEAGAAMRLLQERLTLAYIEHARQCPADPIYPHRENYRPAPVQSIGWPLLIAAGFVVVCVVLLLQATGTLKP